VTQTVGRFQAADRGTLFLDEIGDLPLELQPKLLRVLQEKQFERLGGSHTLRADVRIVAATNQDLGRMVEEKKFRADLYYRLNVFPIYLPPLRDRRGDVRLLAEHFVRKFSEQQGKTIDEIPEELMIALEQHYWPGNIRELQNVIERGVIMTTGSVLSCRTTDQLVMAAADIWGPAGIRTLADAERVHIIATLHATKWVIGGAHGAAAHLGLPRTTPVQPHAAAWDFQSTGPRPDRETVSRHRPAQGVCFRHFRRRCRHLGSDGSRGRLRPMTRRIQLSRLGCL